MKQIHIERIIDRTMCAKVGSQTSKEVRRQVNRGVWAQLNRRKPTIVGWNDVGTHRILMIWI